MCFYDSRSVVRTRLSVVTCQVFSVMDRTGLIDDAFKLAAAGQLPYPTALELIVYLTREQHYTPWRTVMANLKYIGSAFQNTADEKLWRVCDTLREVDYVSTCLLCEVDYISTCLFNNM